MKQPGPLRRAPHERGRIGGGRTLALAISVPMGTLAQGAKGCSAFDHCERVQVGE